MSIQHKQLGKSGWGGARLGSGPKPRPKAKKGTGLVVFSGGKVDPALAEPPADLPESEKVIWRAWAPLALEMRTLSVETVPAFTMLCQLAHQKDGILKQFEQDGAEATAGGMRVFLQCAKQVENLMGRFMLAPFGKPVVSDKPKVAVNPFTAVAG